MTIALAVLVHDGLILASDSATTLFGKDAQTGAVTGVFNVYNNANKVFNLHKGSPIGAYTAGAGSIGDASIALLAKDFRQLLADGQPIGSSGWRFDPASYSIKDVAEALRAFMFEDRYQEAHKNTQGDKPRLVFKVGGYSSGAGLPELWGIDIDNTGTCPPPRQLQPPGQFGMAWDGEPEAIQRLVIGYGSRLGDGLIAVGLPKADLAKAVPVLQSMLEITVAPPAMPMQDAIDLAEFLVHTTIMFSRFKPGAPTVGGPIEIAAISKHEGYRWIRRKHYYPADLNPGD